MKANILFLLLLIVTKNTVLGQSKEIKEPRRMRIVEFMDASDNIQKVGNFVDGKKQGHWIYKTMDDQFLLEAEFSKGEKHGYFTQWSNNQITEEGKFEHGKPVGIWNNYWSNGQLSVVSHYKNGKLFFRSSRDYAGNQIDDGFYEDGVKNGKWSEWRYDYALSDGLRIGEKSQGSYKDDFKNGDWKTWYIDGRLKQEGAYHNDRKAGEWTYWFENGNVCAKGRYHENLCDKVWEFYSPDGEKIIKVEFEQGKIQYTGEWFKYALNGQLIEAGQFDQNVKIGVWNYWYENGQLKATGSYDANGLKIEGTWKYFREDGWQKQCENCK